MKHANLSIFVPHAGCAHRCSFCDQREISAVLQVPTAQQVRQLCQQALAQIPIERRRQTEIAFFGGSFTAIERGAMVALLQAAHAFVGENGFSGIRVSTRPDAISDEILSILRRYSVTAVELGAQSMDDSVLALNQRGHTAQQVVDASRKIQQAGFSLGLQMMVGLYGDQDTTLFDTAQQLIALAPDTVRIYPTVVLRNTPLEVWYRQGVYRPLTLEQGVRLCARLLDQFEQAGIRVIRLGLHADQNLELNRVAGCYHPAFRELCENKRYFDRICVALARCRSKQIVLFCHPASVSQVIGQKKCNLNQLAQMGYEVTVCQDEAMPLKQIKVKDVADCC